VPAIGPDGRQEMEWRRRPAGYRRRVTGLPAAPCWINRRQPAVSSDRWLIYSEIASIPARRIPQRRHERLVI
jgi:hypothetical protein